MSDQPMTNTHTTSMNLRFVLRKIEDREVRILQQMMVPLDWNKHDEYWQDIDCVKEDDVWLIG